MCEGQHNSESSRENVGVKRGEDGGKSYKQDKDKVVRGFIF